ncbi:MAG TPA: hypothetical protein VJT15_24930 [Pyrinomonadaceae bacterium]|nr:hypothetical protein [Pyrinomonadaceae bacterium]
MNASFRQRVFLNPASTDQSSYILVHVESTRNGEHPWGSNMINIADCRRKVELEFYIGTRTARRISLAKINLLIKVLTAFRDALIKEIALIEKPK